MIEYRNVSKEYVSDGSRTLAVDEVSMTVKEGELVVLLGPSGSGKTTLLRLTNRLEELDEGSILIGGKDIQEEDEIELRRRIGYVIQEIGLFPNKNVAENIGLIPGVSGWSGERISERVDELLEMMNMSPERYKERYPAHLSGGEKQRVGVARALAADPDLLLMDEPFAAIDPINRQEIQEQFLQLQQRLQKTTIFVSHDIQEALRLADRIALLREGELVQFARPQKLLLAPAGDFVRDFVGLDRGMKVLELIAVKEVMQETEGEKINAVEGKEGPAIKRGASLKEALNRLVLNEEERLKVVDEAGKSVGSLKFSDIQSYLHSDYRAGYDDDFVSA